MRRARVDDGGMGWKASWRGFARLQKDGFECV